MNKREKQKTTTTTTTTVTKKTEEEVVENTMPKSEIYEYNGKEYGEWKNISKKEAEREGEGKALDEIKDIRSDDDAPQSAEYCHIRIIRKREKDGTINVYTITSYYNEDGSILRKEDCRPATKEEAEKPFPKKKREKEKEKEKEAESKKKKK